MGGCPYIGKFASNAGVLCWHFVDIVVHSLEFVVVLKVNVLDSA